MSVPAAADGSAARGSRTSRFSLTAVAVFACCSAVPAAAQIGATASVFSDDRFRGYSLSDGRPVAILDFSFDDPSGLYLGASGTGVLRTGGNAGLLGVQVDGGYAKRLRSGTTIDFGITHLQYPHYSNGSSSMSYTELYAGIARGGLSSRLFLSPHYFEPGRWTAYGELNGTISPARRWGIVAHAGMLVPLKTPSNEAYRPEFDWSAGVTRELGPVSVNVTWSDGLPGHDHYRDRRHSGSALVVGASWIL